MTRLSNELFALSRLAVAFFCLAQACAANAAPGLPHCYDSLGQKSIEMPAVGSGWLKVRTDESDRVFLPVRIDGTSAVALLDTGATETILDAPFARRLASRTAGAVIREEGDHQRLFSLIRLRIGKLVFRRADWFVMDLKGVSENTIRPDMVIGTDLLNLVAWQVNFDSRRTRFTCSDTVDDQSGIPVRVIGPRILISISINGLELPDVELDTGGAPDVDLSRQTAQDLRLPFVTDRQVRWADGRSLAQLMRVDELKIGPFVLRQRMASVQADLENHLDLGTAILGMGSLRQFNFTLNPQQAFIYLETRKHAPSVDPRSTTGIQFTFANKRYWIDHLMLNSPAASTKLRVGEAICRINGRAVSGNFAERVRLSRPRPGTKLRIRLCSGSKLEVVARHFH